MSGMEFSVPYGRHLFHAQPACVVYDDWAMPVNRLFDFDRAISMKSGLRPAVCGCSGIVSGGPSFLGFGIRRRRV